MYHRPRLPFVEIMITQVCNLSCQGCTNYSDLQHQGYLSWHQGHDWFRAWQQRLELPDIGVMGGEPLINPEWREWLHKNHLDSTGVELLFYRVGSENENMS